MKQFGHGRSAARLLIGLLGIWSLVSCGQATTTPATLAPPTAPAPSPPTASCPFGLQVTAVQRCGTISVPARYTTPQGAQLRLPYVVFGAGTVPSAHATLVLQGGPGAGAGQLAQQLGGLLSQALPKDDVIVFDQRGAGESVPTLSCAASPLLGQLRPDALLAQTQTCLDNFRARGLELADFNTRASADDVAQLARFLGYSALNLYGVSYGTRLAQEVVRRHPGLVQALVLDGVLDPAESWAPLQTRHLHDTLKAFGVACAAAGECPDGPDLPAQLQSAADAIDTAELTFAPGLGAGVPLPITGDLLVLAARTAGTRSGGLFSLPRLFRAVQARDVGTLADLAYRAGADWQGLNLGLFVAVVCQDNRLDAATIQAAHAGLPPVFARSARLYETLGQVCQQAGLTVPPEALASVSAAVPTLLLSGRFDPVTPPAGATRVASRFTPAQHVIFEAGGHVNGLSSPCGQQLLLTFLNNPAARLDTRCAAAPLPGPGVPVAGAPL